MTAVASKTVIIASYVIISMGSIGDVYSLILSSLPLDFS